MTTYRFTPPVELEATPNLKPEFLSRYKHPRGVALVKQGAGFLETRVLLEEHYSGKTDGVEYFIGGMVYSGVPQEVADDLTNAGYGDLLEPE